MVNSLFEVLLVNLRSTATAPRGAGRFFMQGGGAEARWESGIFENEYVKDKGVWKIAPLVPYQPLRDRLVHVQYSALVP